MEKTFSYGFRKRSARKDFKRRHCAHRFIAEPGRRKISLPPMYMIVLDECASPAFWTAYKDYLGTPGEILALFEGCDGLWPKIAKDYFEDDEAKYEHIGFLLGGEPALAPVELILRRRIVIEKLRFDHRNVWFCIYKIRAARAVVDLFYIRTDKGKFMRCVKAVLEQPEYLDDFFCHHEKWYDMTTSEPWGYPGMLQLDKQKKTICNSLGYIDKTFRSERQMYCDIKHPDKVDFQGFFDDYFGDG